MATNLTTIDPEMMDSSQVYEWRKTLHDTGNEEWVHTLKHTLTDTIEPMADWVVTHTKSGDVPSIDTEPGVEDLLYITQPPNESRAENTIYTHFVSVLAPESQLSLFVTNTTIPQTTDPTVVSDIPVKTNSLDRLAPYVAPKKVSPKLTKAAIMAIRHHTSEIARVSFGMTQYAFLQECKKHGILNWNKRHDDKIPFGIRNKEQDHRTEMDVVPRKQPKRDPFDPLSRVNMTSYAHHQGISLQTDAPKDDHSGAYETGPSQRQIIEAAGFLL